MNIGSLIGKGLTGLWGIDTAKEAAKGFKREMKGVNKYDAILNNGIAKPQGGINNIRYSENSSIGRAPLVKSAAVEYRNDGDGKDKKKFMLYAVPAGLLTAAALRARKTGDAFQLWNDIKKIHADEGFRKKRTDEFWGTFSRVNKEEQKAAMKAAKEAEKQFVGELKREAEAKAAKGASAIGKGEFVKNFKAGAGFGTAMVGADVVGSNLAESANKKDRTTQDKKAESSVDSDLVKLAGEVTGVKGYVRKLVREGVLQPSLSAVPIYVTPVAISYALNKDIKSGFEEVRDSESGNKKSRKSKKDKIDNDVLDPRSRNNYAVNSVIMGVASERNAEIEKVAQDISKRVWKIKDWGDFLPELPINGLRAASIAVPTTLLVKKDPIAKHKAEKNEADAEARDKKIINRAAKKAEKKVLDVIAEE